MRYGKDYPGTRKVYADIGGKGGGGGIKDVFGWVVPRTFKDFFRRDAKKLEEQRQKHKELGAQQSSRSYITPGEYIATLQELLLASNTISEYLEILEENGISWDKAMLGAMYPDWFDEEVRDFTEKVLADVGKEERKEIYEKSKDKDSSSAPDITDITGEELGISGPEAKRFCLLQEAAKIFVGRLLVRTRDHTNA
ncbi:hypothetical protein BDV24DRAFT_162789 [Aspergillus arachidicola]|uniref:Uncharacterized protein n=1 Tax=Aspergillus arachidicola TaxID=656916 RepID=A0A2G7FR31_9EURO|nr:hypothetical protein BDV24DRAFT_162789 [Aspergillus arachidicola]PIG83087.1 hypothetical protein AARAC_001226 [Aspergillus arachidicola]